MSFVVYLAASAFAAVSVLLFSRPRRALRDPLTASTCVAITLGSLVFICSAPLTLGAVNRLTGIPNFGAPLTYGMLSAYSCSLLILLFTWRGGPPGTVRRMTLRSITAYGAAIVAIIALFILADADTERLTDLDTYYANAPYMREMILLYLLGHSAATLAICTVCVKWAREVDGLLRTGLRVILAGGVLDCVGFQLMKYTAVVAAWRGHDLSVLSTTVAPPMASLAGLICSVGLSCRGSCLRPSLTGAASATTGGWDGCGPKSGSWPSPRSRPLPGGTSPRTGSTGARYPSTTLCWPWHPTSTTGSA